jgi:hypothetical protein
MTLELNQYKTICRLDTIMSVSIYLLDSTLLISEKRRKSIAKFNSDKFTTKVNVLIK